MPTSHVIAEKLGRHFTENPVVHFMLCYKFNQGRLQLLAFEYIPRNPSGNNPVALPGIASIQLLRSPAESPIMVFVPASGHFVLSDRGLSRHTHQRSVGCRPSQPGHGIQELPQREFRLSRQLRFGSSISRHPINRSRGERQPTTLLRNRTAAHRRLVLRQNGFRGLLTC